MLFKHLARVGLAVVFLSSSKIIAEESSTMKTLIRAVSDGTLETGDVGDLNPYFEGFRSVSIFEDSEIYLSLGYNQKKELVLFGWLKGDRILSVDEATSRWVEERLGQVETEEEMAEWKDFRALLRGAILEVREEGRELEAVAFIDGSAIVGPGSVDHHFAQQPAAFRFVKAPKAGEQLALAPREGLILAAFQH